MRLTDIKDYSLVTDNKGKKVNETSSTRAQRKEKKGPFKNYHMSCQILDPKLKITVDRHHFYPRDTT